MHHLHTRKCISAFHFTTSLFSSWMTNPELLLFTGELISGDKLWCPMKRCWKFRLNLNLKYECNHQSTNEPNCNTEKRKKNIWKTIHSKVFANVLISTQLALHTSLPLTLDCLRLVMPVRAQFSSRAHHRVYEFNKFALSSSVPATCKVVCGPRTYLKGSPRGSILWASKHCLRKFHIYHQSVHPTEMKHFRIKWNCWITVSHWL